MNRLNIILLSSVMLAIGGVIGYKICEKKLKEENRKDIEDILHRMEKYDDLCPDIDEDDSLKNDKEPVVLLKKETKAEEKTEKIDYTKFSKPNLFDYAKSLQEEDASEEEEEEEEEDPEELISDVVEDFDDDEENAYEPHIITEELYNFAVNNNGDDCQLLFYYAEDQVVCEEDDTVVDDYYKILGYDFESELYTATKTWVRNSNNSTVYEIHRIDSSYAKSIANLVETPKEKDFRRAGRLKKARDEE